MASLWDVLDVLDAQPVAGEHPVTMEKLGLDYGFVLYQTKLAAGGELHVTDVHDRVYVYVNRKYFGLIERQDPARAVAIEAAPGDVLNLLVENMGRPAGRRARG
ncbi:hypothetical protein BLSTO_06551 [Blastocystis sp. subtype 1]